jgi:prolyl-tRNA editing enzyme YbaK/EbsC (Cys-tRNA(Pro) deacylase)
VGHAERLETMVEEDLLVEEVWSSAGHTHAVFGMEPTELVRLTGGRVVSVR